MLKVNIIALPVTKERRHSYIPARASPEIMGEDSIPSNILNAVVFLLKKSRKLIFLLKLGKVDNQGSAMCVWVSSKHLVVILNYGSSYIFPNHCKLYIIKSFRRMYGGDLLSVDSQNCVEN